jgi:hypothetical protein
MDTVLYWNSVLLEVSRRDFTSGMPNGQQAGPIGPSRAMAIVHLAIHDTVAYSTSGGTDAAYLAKKGVTPPVTPSIANPIQMDDRVGGAAVAALKAMYPAYAKFIDDSVPSPPPVLADVLFGAKVAAKILQLRTNDGSQQDIFGPQVPNPGYGVHRSDPYQPGQENLGPLWGTVKRFTGTAHQPLDPFPGHGQTNFLANPDYKDDFEEVRDSGAIARNKRTAEEERIGVYWGYDGGRGIGVPPRLYLQIAREVIKNRMLTTQQLAELFAMLTVAMADAGIDAWKYKYLFNLWRPVVVTYSGRRTAFPSRTRSAGGPGRRPSRPILPATRPLAQPYSRFSAARSGRPTPRSRSTMCSPREGASSVRSLPKHSHSSLMSSMALPAIRTVRAARGSTSRSRRSRRRSGRIRSAASISACTGASTAFRACRRRISAASHSALRSA